MSHTRKHPGADRGQRRPDRKEARRLSAQQRQAEWEALTETERRTKSDSWKADREDR